MVLNAIPHVHARTNAPTNNFFILFFLKPKRSRTELTSTPSCVVRHSGRVQRVSSDEAITGLYTFPPVRPALHLSADAVKPSVLPDRLTCPLSPPHFLSLLYLLYV